MQIVPSGNWEALSQKIVIGLQFWLHKMWLRIILDIHGMTHCHNWYDKQVTKLFYSAILRIFLITTVTWGCISLHSFDSIIKITHNKNNSSINNWISLEEKKNPTNMCIHFQVFLMYKELWSDKVIRSQFQLRIIFQTNWSSLLKQTRWKGHQRTLHDC